MQYALIEIQDRKLLIDANEIQSLNEFNDSIAELETPDWSESSKGRRPFSTIFPYHICYGSYMPQPGIDEKKGVEDLTFARDHFLGFVQREKCHVIALSDINVMDALPVGRTFHIPFAALVQASDFVIGEIGEKRSSRAVTGFLRYKNMSPATNILNRPGIIALKGIERRTNNEAISPENWRKYIDRDSAKRIAQKIK